MNLMEVGRDEVSDVLEEGTKPMHWSSSRAGNALPQPVYLVVFKSFLSPWEAFLCWVTHGRITLLGPR